MLRAVGRYGDGFFPAFPHSPHEYAQRLEAVRTAASDAGRDPMKIVPAIWMMTVAGRTPEAVDEAIECEVIKAFGLNVSDEFFAKYGAQHPLGVGFAGAQDLLPHGFDEQEALSYIKKIPTEVVRNGLLTGTPGEIADRVAEWRDHGVRYLVLANIGMMQRHLRKGLASQVAFSQAVSRLKKL
jgi:phthiodiolone/phenolphthiodiolone dimycocerosates ketoreductase